MSAVASWLHRGPSQAIRARRPVTPRAPAGVAGWTHPCPPTRIASARSTPPSSISRPTARRCTSAGRCASPARRRRSRRCAATSTGASRRCRASAAASSSRRSASATRTGPTTPGSTSRATCTRCAWRRPPGPAELRDLAGVLLAAPLDPHRPLWRMTLVTGLQGGGFALVGQAHHALVDGVAALEVAALVLDPLAGAGAGRGRAASAGRPRAPPSAAGALGAAVRQRVDAAARRPRASSPAARPAPRRRRVAGSLALPTATTALERSLTRERRTAFASAPLADVREAARRHDATVNDALLAASAVALGAALRRRGEQPAAVRALVPASTRGRRRGRRRPRQPHRVPRDRPAARRARPGARAAHGPRAHAARASAPVTPGAGDALLRSADLLPAGGPQGRRARRRPRRAVHARRLERHRPGRRRSRCSGAS